jgi:hypothetical protein
MSPWAKVPELDPAGGECEDECRPSLRSRWSSARRITAVTHGWRDDEFEDSECRHGLVGATMRPSLQRRAVAWREEDVVAQQL